MNDGITIDILVEFDAVFDEPPKSLKEYLTGISRSTLLNVAAFFLGFSNHSSKYGKYEDFLSMFFCKENQLIANQIFRKLQILEQRNQAKLLITNPITILELFEFVFENLDEQETQSSPEIEVNVFKSLLLINQHLVLAQSPSGTSTKDVPDNLRVAALSLSQSYPYTDLVNYDASEVLAAQMVKSIFLFEFLAEHKKTASLISQLLEYFDCPDWKYFLKSLLPLSIAVLNSKREAHIDIAINKNEDFEKGCIFLEKLMVTDSEVLKDFDYIKLRSKPFYKIRNGVYRIINGLFVIELLYKGIYFKLFEINNNQQENAKIKNIRSFYCDEFSEKYLFYKLLNSIYQNKYIEFSGEDLKKFKIDGEPDYYIRNGNNLFLFESKDILINASIKSSYDFKQYEPEFEKKLYFEIKDGKKNKKAILQLINSIENILSKSNTFDTNYKTTSIKIYPILVLHDRQFNVTGLNLLINEWFQEELKHLSQKGLYTQKVRPLVIIDIDTFIFHQDLFRNRTLKLNLILDEYFKFITFDKNKKYISDDHVIRHAKRTLMSFSLFLFNYVYDHNIRKVPGMILEKGVKLFD